jgi:molybdopterin molybdotransferase
MNASPSLLDIAAKLSGYNPEDLPAQVALNFLTELVEPITETEQVSILASLGRVIASDVISPFDVPPHDNAAMDGFALNGSQLNLTQTLTLKVIGTALAGQAWHGEVKQGECIRIMTGALLPIGLDTVVPHEFCEMLSPNLVRLPLGKTKAGDNRRLRAEDLRQGSPALRQGSLVTPAAAGLLASLGLPHVHVFRRLKVAYFSTGNEILSIGQPQREGAVYDSNRYTVMGLLQQLGCETIDMGVVPDHPQMLEQTLTQAALSADVIVTSGGVSAGDADFTQAMMKKLGDVVFWKIAMRPGRPMAVGHITQGHRKALLFGLPGNPVAFMVSFLVFIQPALRRMMGSQKMPSPMVRAKTQEVLRKKVGRTEYLRGVVSKNAEGELQVMTTGNQGSGVLSSMVQANGLIVLSHHHPSAQIGDWVDVMLLSL